MIIHLVNPVGRGSNQFVDNIEIGDVIISEDDISYIMSHIKHSIKTKGLLIYEG